MQMRSYVVLLVLLLVQLMAAWHAKAQDNTITHRVNDSVVLTLERIPFNETAHTVSYEGDFPVAIDGTPIFGTDGDLPKFKLERAELTIGAARYQLQTDHMYNPWFGAGINPNLIYFYKDGSNYHLQVVCSDGAGTYGAEWMMVGDASIRTILTRDERILFEYFGSP